VQSWQSQTICGVGNEPARPDVVLGQDRRERAVDTTRQAHVRCAVSIGAEGGLLRPSLRIFNFLFGTVAHLVRAEVARSTRAGPANKKHMASVFS
jgi:hypothetical protein